jgi:hypothetical protein
LRWVWDMEPAISFNHAAQKLEWAFMHMDQLNARCAAFLETQPQVAFVENDPEGGGQSFKVGMSREIPAAIPLIIGDVVSNTRASLDFAWMGLVRAAKTNIKKATMPIANNRKGLINTDMEPWVGEAAAVAKTLLADTIKAHRDIANGGNKAIAALNELANWNKHNMLIVQRGRTTLRNVSWGAGNTIGTLVNEGGINSVFGFGGPQTYVSYEGEPAGEIVFGRHYLVEYAPIIPTLIYMWEAACEALKTFCDAFPHPENPEIQRL